MTYENFPASRQTFFLDLGAGSRPRRFIQQASATAQNTKAIPQDESAVTIRTSTTDRQLTTSLVVGDAVGVGPGRDVKTSKERVEHPWIEPTLATVGQDLSTDS